MTHTNELDFLPKVLGEHRALQILRIMVNPSCNRSATDRLLHDCLEICGLYCARPALRKLLDDMEARGLLVTHKAEDCIVARLTEKGERVGLGKDRIEGVATFYPD
ncbi:hypothetical protein LXM94_23815 [Rhizobium sp. TRM95111]|uniref:VpaChn25_0724 family phage protein n=1 Tax=Rhizobium alarense TaxID=2846851 RepID=UPI001F1F009B|nr:hypothetical protein [Rhizobium alarense]MCF3642994.1 hypothetical protein [Rhizobium alarense]